MEPTATLVEIAALLAVAQDHAFGQPPGAQLRATALGQRLAIAAGMDASERETTWWTSALRFLGCTGHAYDTSIVFGDEIDLRARSLEADASNPIEFLRLMLSHAGPGTTGVRRFRSVLAVLAGGKKAAELNFRMACEVADAFALRLGLAGEVRAALRTNFERWNGRGLPSGVKGEMIPRPMRIAQLAQELEVLARVEGIDRALDLIRTRRGKAYDPSLADAAIDGGRSWWSEVEPLDPWELALAFAPAASPLTAAAFDDVLVLLADFADLKSPWTSGHSRAVADLVCATAGPAASGAALVHDLGRVAIPSSVWDKPGLLTLDERDRVETHSLVTEQLLRRIPALAALASTAGAAHERTDGSGYHKRLGAAHLGVVARLVAAADCYQAMVSDRPHRAALAPDAAAAELRSMSAASRLDGESVEAVLAAAGHRRRARAPMPAGLTAREVEVLRLLTLGLRTREIAERLVISAKTADHHIQHVYTKIGVSTRGAAALFAIEQGILPADV